MGTNAAAHAATFSWDNTAAATLQAYRKAVLAALLARRSPPATTLAVTSAWLSRSPRVLGSQRYSPEILQRLPLQP